MRPDQELGNTCCWRRWHQQQLRMMLDAAAAGPASNRPHHGSLTCTVATTLLAFVSFMPVTERTSGAGAANDLDSTVPLVLRPVRSVVKASAAAAANGVLLMAK